MAITVPRTVPLKQKEIKLKFLKPTRPKEQCLKHNIQRCASMHPNNFKGQGIQVAAMFIFEININRNHTFSITLLTSQFLNKNCYKTYLNSSL